MTLDYIKDSSDTIRSFKAIKLLYTKIFVDGLTKKGKVLIKNETILTGEFVNSHLAYCKHANGRDWWIVVEEYNSSKHLIFLLSKNGIKLHSTQDIGSSGGLYDWSGNSIFSPDGGKFIKYAYDYFIQIFDFDRCMGKFSNPIILQNSNLLNYKESSIAISPDSRFLYVSNYNRIWQFDLYSSDISKSIDTIGYWDGFLFDTIFSTAFYQLALADDDKIYLSCYSSNIFLHRINNPNGKGVNCNFKLRDIELPAWMIGGLPIMPNFKLGEVSGSNCDSLTSNRDFNPIKSFIISPNPANGELKIVNLNSGNSEALKIEVLDISAKVKISRILFPYQNQWNFDLSFLSPGLYFIQFYKDHRLIQSNKWILN
ncbi:MAG: T9SS type A sorting domain-containing protein [Saprospiraceae bacterium]|nr:T9SS type A sorting domain-containing protein [Saprospiraceae bacterium]